jgi:hypothetical protein
VRVNQTGIGRLCIAPENVAGWRLEQLLHAGYAREAATALAARRDVDLHVAIRLLAKGCPPETALRILL